MNILKECYLEVHIFDNIVLLPLVHIGEDRFMLQGKTTYYDTNNAIVKWIQENYHTTELQYTKFIEYRKEALDKLTSYLTEDYSPTDINSIKIPEFFGEMSEVVTEWDDYDLEFSDIMLTQKKFFTKRNHEFNPMSSYFLIVDGKGNIKKLSLETRKYIITYEGVINPNLIHLLVISTNKEFLYFFNSNDSKLVQWSINEGMVKNKFEFIGTTAITDIQISYNNDFLIVAGKNGEFGMFVLINGNKRLVRLNNVSLELFHNISQIKITNNGEFAYISFLKGDLVLFGIQEKKIVKKFGKINYGFFGSKLSPDGEY